MGYIQRDLEENIRNYIEKKEIIAIVGARQCGKTTLMEHIFKDLKRAVFISFEDRKILSFFENDIDSFAELYVKNYDYLFIDEFQYAKNGGKNLKYIYDTIRIKIIISGSSSSELSIQSIKYLVGRIFVFTLYPLSFSEYLRYKQERMYLIYLKRNNFSKEVLFSLQKIYEEFVIYGGYPRVVLSENSEEKKVVLRNIYNTYLLKEVKEIMEIRDDYKIAKLIHGLALQIGSLINYHELSQLTESNYRELLMYINILKKTFVISESRPFYENKRKELTKNPKIYFIDNGFRNIILNNFQKKNERVDKGQLNENFVSNELLKRNIELRYWRTKSKAEVDFIIEKNSSIIPVEVKSDLRDIKITRSLFSFMRKYKAKNSFVLSESLQQDVKREQFKIYFRPLFSIGTIAL
ncbi:ATP-binding protein [Candidatus Pacearchaeota archaeon]|nr:ATP-binding protein [Candidatus Pacearchaeota archaeon]